MPSTADRRFTVPEDVLLAGCVSKHRCLYDKDHMYHGDRKIKERLWAEIAKTLDRSVVSMRGPHTPPGSPPPSPTPEQQEERIYNGGAVGMRGPHTPPGSPPPSPIHEEEEEDYSGRQVMANNSPVVMLASQNPSPDTEGFSSEGQIAGKMTRKRNQNRLPVSQPLLPVASGSSTFHGRPEASRSQNHDEPKNGPPWRPQQYRETRYEYRSPSNLRRRNERQPQLKSKESNFKQQVMNAPWLSRESVEHTPSVPTTSSAATGAASQTPEEHIDGEPFERVGRLKPRE